MKWMRCRVEVYKKTGEREWDSTPIVFENITNFKISFSLDKKDTCNVDLHSSFDYTNNEQIFGDIDYDDYVQIYAWNHSGDYTSDDLIFSGLVQKLPRKLDYSTGSVSFTLISKAEALFDVVIPVVYTTNKKFYEIVQVILNTLNNYAQASAGDKRYLSLHPSNPTTKQDGSDFPTISRFIYGRQKAYDLINKLMTNQYTEDGDYFWYVDLDNRLVYQPRSIDVDGILDISEVYSYNVNYDMDIVNYLVIDIGYDCFGVGRNVFIWDSASLAKYGSKMKYIFDFRNTIELVIENEFRAKYAVDSSAWEVDANNRRVSNFPTDSALSAGYTFETITDGATPITVYNKQDFNEKIVEAAEQIGKAIGMRILQRGANPKLNLTVTLPFTTSYTVGNLLQIGWLNNKRLRIYEVVYMPHRTQLKLKEDWVTVV